MSDRAALEHAQRLADPFANAEGSFRSGFIAGVVRFARAVRSGDRLALTACGLAPAVDYRDEFPDAHRDRGAAQRVAQRARDDARLLAERRDAADGDADPRRAAILDAVHCTRCGHRHPGDCLA